MDRVPFCTDVIGTMNMRLHWVRLQASSLFTQVTQGMPCESLLCPAQTLLQSPLPQGLGPCDVLVLELSDAPGCWDPARLHTFFQLPERPLTLVLVSGQRKDHTLAWLDAGADRCLPCDSETSAIQAMIRALLHRRRGLLATYTEHGLLRFEHDTHTLFSGSERIPLTQRETGVARLLFQQVWRPVRHDEILQALCAEGQRACAPALVSLYIHRINKKIRPYGVHIGFKRGYGYRLHVEDSAHHEPPTVDWLGAWRGPALAAAPARPPQKAPSHAQHRGY